MNPKEHMEMIHGVKGCVCHSLSHYENLPRVMYQLFTGTIASSVKCDDSDDGVTLHTLKTLSTKVHHFLTKINRKLGKAKSYYHLKRARKSTSYPKCS